MGNPTGAAGRDRIRIARAARKARKLRLHDLRQREAAKQADEKGIDELMRRLGDLAPLRKGPAIKLVRSRYGQTHPALRATRDARLASGEARALLPGGKGDSRQHPRNVPVVRKFKRKKPAFAGGIVEKYWHGGDAHRKRGAAGRAQASKWRDAFD